MAVVCLVSACSVAKLEARLEANPQCKDVINSKTGALMPCPGSDKAFYREIGLAPVKPVTPISSIAVTTNNPGNPTSTASTPASSPKAAIPPTDCKPQIHKKTGGTLPCPASD